MCEQEKEGELICLCGDFNIAPLEIDIHDPNRYEGGIMASKIEEMHLIMFSKEDFLIHFESSNKILVIGVGGITVIMHMN